MYETRLFQHRNKAQSENASIRRCCFGTVVKVNTPIGAQLPVTVYLYVLEAFLYNIIFQQGREILNHKRFFVTERTNLQYFNPSH